MSEINVTNRVLQKIKLFNRLSDDSLDRVRAALEPRRLAAGEILFNQGEPGQALIIVLEGKIGIFTPVEGKTDYIHPIRVFQAGETLGEMAIIDEKPRSMSARAEGEATILALSAASFRRLVQEHPAMAIAVMSDLSDRIRYTVDFIEEVRQWVRRIAEGNYQSATPAGGQYQDSTLAALAADFVQMAVKVQEREENLRKELLQLRIEIDQARKKQDVEQIMSSNYYQDLKEKVKSLRQKSDQSDV